MFVCVHMCLGVLTGAQFQSECTNWGPQRVIQVGSGSGVVVVLQRGACSFPCFLSPSLSLLSGNGGVWK